MDMENKMWEISERGWVILQNTQKYKNRKWFIWLLKGGGDNSVDKLSTSHAEDQGLNPGGGLAWVTPIHEREGKRLPAVKSYCTS